jgi:uncharacterized protein YegL
MTNQDCLIVFVLDQSGSMIGVRYQTIEGVNKFLEDQKKVEGQTLVTLTLFDTLFNTPYVAASIDTVANLGTDENTYNPNGMTALFDAVGDAVKRTEEWVSANNWQGQIKVVILTDGEENASSEWHINNPRQDNDDRDIAGLIEWKQNEGWDFVFMGAGGTQWLERTFNTLPSNSFYAYAGDAASTRHAHTHLSASMTTSRVTGNSIGSTMNVDPADNSHVHDITDDVV